MLPRRLLKLLLSQDAPEARLSLFKDLFHLLWSVKTLFSAAMCVPLDGPFIPVPCLFRFTSLGPVCLRYDSATTVCQSNDSARPGGV